MNQTSEALRYHYVFSEDSNWINLHTHEFDSLPDSPHHDFQVVLPLTMETGVYILYSVIQWAMDRIEPIVPNTSYFDILLPNKDNVPVPLQFVETEETGRPVWRVLIPDSQMNFGSNAESPYCNQSTAII